MIQDWDDAYENRAHIPGGDDYPPKWDAAAATFRAQMSAAGRARLDIAYGAAPRERLDLFLPDGDAHGLLIFVHGGYWRMFDKSTWSHLAQGPLHRGWAVAMPSYTLCPESRIPAITRQVAQAIATVCPLVPGPLHLAGHSAGGHLVARMGCADGPLDPASRERLSRIVTISGVHDLRPFPRLKFNDDLHLDEATTLSESPALLRPIEGLALHCWVGANERPEFVRQNALLANIWTGLGADTRCHEEPNRHHFSVIEDLLSPQSGLTEAVVGAWT